MIFHLSDDGQHHDGTKRAEPAGRPSHILPEDKPTWAGLTTAVLVWSPRVIPTDQRRSLIIIKFDRAEHFIYVASFLCNDATGVVTWCDAYISHRWQDFSMKNSERLLVFVLHVDVCINKVASDAPSRHAEISIQKRCGQLSAHWSNHSNWNKSYHCSKCSEVIVKLDVFPELSL